MKTKKPIDLVPYYKTGEVTYHRRQSSNVVDCVSSHYELTCYESYDSSDKISLTLFFVVAFLSGSLIRFFSYNGTFRESLMVGMFSVLCAFVMVALAHFLLKIGSFYLSFFELSL